ncbi:copper chaperone PCu(A)C [Streptosporangium sp. NPDC023963]|uniref:copper chaperone PCu(A)C n=1 Tax=Streptosporangium sp. NPDC023963 TaxID=3155608 RepID=UPI00344A394A
MSARRINRAGTSRHGVTRVTHAGIRRTAPAGVLLAAVMVLGGCGSEGSTAPAAAPSTAAPAATPSTPSTAAVAAVALTITDPWVKTAKKGMSAAFGTLVNNTDAEVTVVSGASPLSPKIELHEVVDSKGKMIMRPKEGGIVIPARGTHLLQPGGDHIMLMGITEAVKPGAQIPFTLTLKDGKTVEFTAVGKDFAGGKEDYRPGMDMGDGHGDKGDKGMDMGESNG